jgi:hypothetical protein
MNAARSEYAARFFQDSDVELYFNNSKKFETNTSGCQVTGHLVADRVAVGDGEFLQCGNDDDLQILHDSGQNIIQNTVANTNIKIQGVNSEGGTPVIELNPRRDQQGLSVKANQGVELFYDNSKKLHTDSNGVTISGRLLLGDSSGANDDRIRLGADGDLSLYHDGSDSYIVNDTGALIIKADSARVGIQLNNNGKTALFYQGNEKFKTTSDGATIIGRLSPDANNTYGLGTSSKRFANFFSVTGNFSGNVDFGSGIDVTGATTLTRSTDNATTTVITNNGTTGGNCLKLTSGGTGAGTSIFSVFRNNQSSEAEVFKIDGAGAITSTGDLTISKADAKLKLLSTDTSSPNYPGIDFDTANNQGATLECNIFDSELPTAGLGLVVKKSASNTESGTLTFNVLGDIYAGATSLSSLSRVLTTADEGSGNGLDADTLDGVQGSSFLRSDAADTASGDITFSGGAGAATIGANSDIRFTSGSWTGESCKIQHHGNRLYIQGGSDGIDLRGSDSGTMVRVRNTSIEFVDNATFEGNIAVSGTVDGRDVASDGSKLDGIESGATADQSASEILTLIKTVDGSGSGLDADTLDGANASVSASNSTIVQRHSSGYIFANYFNTTANDVSSGVTKIMVETGNDNYIRHGDAAAVRSFLNVADGATAGVASTGGTFSGDVGFSGGAGAATINGGSDIRFSHGSWTGEATKIQGHNNYMYIQGGSNGIIFRRSNGTDNWFITSSGHFIPGPNNSLDLGGSSNRIRNIYTNDLNLSNEGGSNDVDGTWGSYTIQEGAESLFLINRRNGKKYKFNLTEVS